MQRPKLTRVGGVTIPDCRTCGLCCIALQDTEIWAEVTMADAVRLGSPWCKKHIIGFSLLSMVCRAPGASLGGIETVWREVKAGPMKGVRVCVCVALRGSPLHRCSCRVYDKRPEVCRKALNPGEKQCLEARRMYREAAGIE